MQKLPEMTVEKRDSKTAHGLYPPIQPDTPEYLKQISDMLELCQGAKVNAGPNEGHWPERVIEILQEHAPFQMHDVELSLSRFGFYGWSDCVRFVMDDNCDDFASLLLRYTQREKIPHKDNKGFIDGDGIGFKRRYIDRLGRKGDSPGSLEKAFDAKYFFKQARPLVALQEILGPDAANCMVNYIHPGHWAFPAGHGAKFYEAADLARDTWDLSEVQDDIILTASYVLAMARSGGGVHFPEDNIASGYLAGLPEFAQYGE